MGDDLERLKEVVRIAYKLKWVTPTKVSYPLMQMSEVEKCMLAMVDNSELENMRVWEKDVDEGRIIPEADTAVTDLVSFGSERTRAQTNPPKSPKPPTTEQEKPE